MPARWALDWAVARQASPVYLMMILSLSHGDDVGQCDLPHSWNLAKIFRKFTPRSAGLRRIAQYTRRKRDSSR